MGPYIQKRRRWEMVDGISIVSKVLGNGGQFLGLYSYERYCTQQTAATTANSVNRNSMSMARVSS